MQDTIYALSTPQGTGGVAVIRISGPQAEQALQALFVPMGAKELTPRVLQYGRFMHSGQEIDDGMAVFFRGPHLSLIHI